MTIVTMVYLPGVRVSRIARMRVLLLPVAAGEGVAKLVHSLLYGADLEIHQA
jgi:hypothetical protein